MKLKIGFFTFEFEILLIIIFFSSIFSVIIRDMMYSFYMCYLFIIFHEMSHMLVASIYGKEIKAFKFYLSGVSIVIDDKIRLKKFKEILIYLAGPVSNIILCIMFKENKFIYEINMGLALINLFPIFPLDGYNILLTIINNKKILNIISVLFLVCMYIISIAELILFRKISALIFCLYVTLINAKNGEKWGKNRY